MTTRRHCSAVVHHGDGVRGAVPSRHRVRRLGADGDRCDRGERRQRGEQRRDDHKTLQEGQEPQARPARRGGRCRLGHCLPHVSCARRPTRASSVANGGTESGGASARHCHGTRLPAPMTARGLDLHMVFRTGWCAQQDGSTSGRSDTASAGADRGRGAGQAGTAPSDSSRRWTAGAIRSTHRRVLRSARVEAVVGDEGPVVRRPQREVVDVDVGDRARGRRLGQDGVHGPDGGGLAGRVSVRGALGRDRVVGRRDRQQAIGRQARRRAPRGSRPRWRGRRPARPPGRRR